MAITQVGIPFINKNKLDLFLNYTIVEVENIDQLTIEEGNKVINACNTSFSNNLPILLISKTDYNKYVYIINWSLGSGAVEVNGLGSDKQFYEYLIYDNETPTIDIYTIATKEGYNSFTGSNNFTKMVDMPSLGLRGETGNIGTNVSILSYSLDVLNFQVYNATAKKRINYYLKSNANDDGANILTDKNANTYLTGKLDKSTSKKVVYTNNDSGTPSTISYSVSPNNSALAQFNSTGQLYTNAPTADIHAANKKYVDDQVATKQNTISLTENEDGTVTMTLD